MLTSAIRPVFIGALATGSVAAIAAEGGPAADQDPSVVATFRPIEGISYELGSKRAVGYFEPRNGKRLVTFKCLVTLMIAEKVDPDQARPSSAARLSLAMLPGQSAALASEEGTSMEITCGAGAETVAVKRRTLGQLRAIQRLHAAHRGRYGAPKIHAALRARGHAASRGRVERLMRHQGIRATMPRRFRLCTTDSRHDLPVAPNRLDQKFASGSRSGDLVALPPEALYGAARPAVNSYIRFVWITPRGFCIAGRHWEQASLSARSPTRAAFATILISHENFDIGSVTRQAPTQKDLVAPSTEQCAVIGS
jgi:hypothetical protein